jgi:acetoin utilization protein AcuC
VSERVELVRYGDDVPMYDHGPEHPLRPARVTLTRRLILDYGIVDGVRAREVDARDASDEELLRVHTAGYLDAVKRAGHGEAGEWARYGLGPGDNPIFPDMHEAAAHVAGATITAAEAVLSGRVEHAFNPAGGLHHAMPERASGFCVYDDPAVAIAWMLDHGASRVAYVDVDVHHGDGPQAIFYDDPRVLTISIHQDGRTLFPGTGFVDETGRGEAVGTKVNVPVPPQTGDGAWLSALESIVPPLVTAWKPDVLVTQLGCDTHTTDPLAWLDLTTAAYRRAAVVLHGLAHEAAGGRWVATGGGGYQWARVVPRAWTICFAEMAGAEIPDFLPEAWLELVRHEYRMSVPEFLSEEPVPNRGRDEAVDRVVAEVRSRIFPAHGLPA